MEFLKYNGFLIFVKVTIWELGIAAHIPTSKHHRVKLSYCSWWLVPIKSCANSGKGQTELSWMTVTYQLICCVTLLDAKRKRLSHALVQIPCCCLFVCLFVYFAWLTSKIERKIYIEQLLRLWSCPSPAG